MKGHGLTRALWVATAATLLASLAAVAYFVASTLRGRLPYWGEAEVLFEATRLRRGLALFVDPTVGAADMGLPPSRWYVTYPPIWTACVALVPERAALVVGRLVCTCAWFGALAGIAWSTPPGRRLDTTACAAFIGGSWVLTNFAMLGRPDSIACALAAAGLVRAVRRGRIDHVSAVLLVLAPWVKPTLLGLPAGAFAADLLYRRARALPSLAVAAGAFLVAFAILSRVSGGELLSHVIQSNAQPMTLEAWLDHVPSRVLFFAPPIAWAAWSGLYARGEPGIRLGLGALGASVAWVLVALAKTGSASNYWMEPCIAALVLVAHAPRTSFRFGRSGPLHAAIALGAALYAGVAAIGASLGHAREDLADAAFVASIPARCGVTEGDVVAADEAGIEFALNGRILTPTYQMVHLVRAGRYPASTWVRDLRSPRVRCVVEHTKQMRLSPELDRFLTEHFEAWPEERGFRILVPKTPRESP